MREAGYYWVKFKGEQVKEAAVWLYANDANCFWLRTGSADKFYDWQIEWVGLRIPPPEEDKLDK